MLVIHYNSELVTRYDKGELKVASVDPSILEEKWLQATTPDLVVVSQLLSTEDQTKALTFGYRVTNYKNNNLSKVVMI
jgi:hypothetical protein